MKLRSCLIPSCRICPLGASAYFMTLRWTQSYTGYTGYRWVVEATPDQHPLECSSVRKVHESWRLGRTHQCQRFWTLLAQLILYFIQLSPLIILCKKKLDGLFLEKSGSPCRNCVLWCSLSFTWRSMFTKRDACRQNIANTDKNDVPDESGHTKNAVLDMAKRRSEI